MRKPLTAWDDTPRPQWNFEDCPDLVWGTVLDGRYQIEVQRIEHYRGELCVFDHQDGNRLLKSWTVGLSYGALFGPDVDDVNDWQERVLEFVDGLQKDEPSED